MKCVGEDGGCVPVGEIEELNWDALLVGRYSHVGEEEVD